MKTADDIVKELIPCTCGEIYLSRGLVAPDCMYHSFDWETPIQKIAELAFDAGVNNGCKEFIDNNNLQKRFIWAGENPQTKEQFIQQLFPNQITKP